MKTQKVISLLFLSILAALCWQLWSQVQAEESDFKVLISELSPADSTHDWAELYVLSGSGNVANFVLTDLDGTDSMLAQDVVTLTEGDYAVVHWTTGVDETDLVGDSNNNGYRDLYLADSSLSATDDQLVLLNDEEILDAVIWSNHDGSLASSELDDNLDLVAAEAWQGTFALDDQSGAVLLGEIDQSIARLETGDTNSKDDWQILASPTPGAANIVHTPPAKPNLILQEIGTGSALLAWDSVAEISGYELYEAILSGDYALPLATLDTTETSYESTGLEQDEIYYYKLRALNEQGLFTDSDELEVHTESSNETPTAYINAPEQGFTGEELVLEASDSFDPEDEPLLFNWAEDENNPQRDILETDNEEARFVAEEAGAYKFSLVVTDGENESDEVLAEIDILVPTAESYSDEIVINEILPNPVGADTEDEFIELKNLGDEAVNLVNWQLDDLATGGSKAYTLPSKTIQADSLLVIKRSESALALNNDADEVNFLNPAGEIVDSISYDESFGEGEAYARTTAGTFQRTTIVTEGKENEFSEAEETDDTPNDSTSSASSSSNTQTASATCEKLSLEAAKENLEDTLCIEASVSSDWGQLGKNLLYLQDGNVAVQGYSSTEITAQIGQKLALEGKMSELTSGLRFKITAWEELTGKTEFTALAINADALSDEYLGRLVKVSGEVTKNSGNTFYLNDSTGELKIVVQESAFTKPETPKGTELEVVGILDQTSSGYRILPRSLDDLYSATTKLVAPAALSKTGIGLSYGIILCMLSCLPILLMRVKFCKFLGVSLKSS
ncbi:MAG: lamin tail domain-containing protein [Candidatus Gracilibacteria bacterium]|nr:lamin tail domain-containing protein [Candidatus Gracilibacteria bacterium]